MRRATLALVHLTVLLAVPLLAGCSGGVPGTPAPDPAGLGWSVRSALAGLPATALAAADFSTIVVGDLDGASTLAGVARPASGADPDQIMEWALDVTGARFTAGSPPKVGVLLPDAVIPTAVGSSDEIIDELGWNLANVASFAEIQAPPANFAVLTGDFEESSLTAAMGDPVDGVWRIGPSEDGAVDLSTVTPARMLGESLRTGLRDDTIAVSRTTPPVSGWLAGAPGVDTVPDLAALADALDAHGVISAVLAPRAESMFGRDAVLDPFTALAVGSAVVDGQPTLVFAYRFPDDATAAANVEILENLVAEGRSAQTGRAWSEVLSVSSVTADGPVLTAVLSLVDGTPDLGWKILYQQDSFAVHR